MHIQRWGWVSDDCGEWGRGGGAQRSGDGVVRGERGVRVGGEGNLRVSDDTVERLSGSRDRSTWFPFTSAPASPHVYVQGSRGGRDGGGDREFGVEGGAGTR